MDKSLETQLKQIFDAVLLHSVEEYAIGGQRYPVSGLESQLYNVCYSREFRVPLDLSLWPRRIPLGHTASSWN